MNQGRLFKTKLVPSEKGSGELFEKKFVSATQGPVTCLGITFENDSARRDHFSRELQKKLNDATFRKTEGFPHAEDEDILFLSDPPYYTACPNPWMAEFIAEWEDRKPHKPDDFQYHREPFAADVSEGKNHPIYSAHSYHTKVPHRAIMKYLLHYTEPGDIVFDGFSGTGMTGVAAQLCGDSTEVSALGFRVEKDGSILQKEGSKDTQKSWTPISKLGVRKAILNDLSPAATFIGFNYNSPVDLAAFRDISEKIITEIESECRWLYETKHTDGKLGAINYTVWSDIYICPQCTHEIVFWDSAVDREAGVVHSEFDCSYCAAKLKKRDLERAWTREFDPLTNKSESRYKQKPVLINYSFEGKRYEKIPDQADLELIRKVEDSVIPYFVPSNEVIGGKEIGRLAALKIKNVHQLVPKRSNWILGAFLARCKNYPRLAIAVTSSLLNLSWMYRWRANGKGGTTSGTYYICATPQENNAIKQIKTKLRDLTRAIIAGENIISTQDSGSLNIKPDSVDYIFLDPPFGSNLMYSELSFLWESWLKVWTNNLSEAIENKNQGKSLFEYRQLMTVCFREAYRILKPGRWMTVEFSNTRASVWNSIQTALTEVGFLVANVSALDKQQGSFKAVTTSTAVKQDLVISAYKPNGGFEERFQNEADTEAGVWDFVRTHLSYLPVVKKQGVIIQFIPERDPRILFDQMIAYYVRKGFPVPISSQNFQDGLARRFHERDGMYFLPDQVSEYDKKKLTYGQIKQESLFVSDESTAIQWLHQLIKVKPQTFSDINPQFMQQLGGWSKNESQLDLREILNQNFLKYDRVGPVPEQIHAYLSSNWKDLRNLSKDDPKLVEKALERWYVPDPNKVGDLEKLREKELLKEFEEYKKVQNKIKIFRLEAVRIGFRNAWQNHDYLTIINIANRLPTKVLDEDPKLLMYYDQAETRMKGT